MHSTLHKQRMVDGRSVASYYPLGSIKASPWQCYQIPFRAHFPILYSRGGEARKGSLHGGVLPRPSTLTLFKTRSVYFATLFKTRDLYILIILLVSCSSCLPCFSFPLQKVFFFINDTIELDCWYPDVGFKAFSPERQPVQDAK